MHLHSIYKQYIDLSLQWLHLQLAICLCIVLGKHLLALMNLARESCCTITVHIKSSESGHLVIRVPSGAAGRLLCYSTTSSTGTSTSALAFHPDGSMDVPCAVKITGCQTNSRYSLV